jgi:hypothetical protein
MNGEHLHSSDLHASDEQLLLYADRESRTLLGGEIQAHLESCSQCRSRLAALEGTLDEFAGAHRETWDAVLPPASGAHALLKARLAELAAQEPALHSSRSSWFAVLGQRRAAFAAAMVAACLLLAIRLHRPTNFSPELSATLSASLGHWDEPNRRLTPGATIPVTRNEVCSEAEIKSVPVIPVSLATRVFELYGVTPPRPDAYEVDYLITPELGGATDIRNLWPEPYQETEWNAHIKDQLEDRLHEMVCHGDLDLATAQRDISADWIAAYRKYFHTERPLIESTSVSHSAVKQLHPRA